MGQASFKRKSDFVSEDASQVRVLIEGRNSRVSEVAEDFLGGDVTASTESVIDLSGLKASLLAVFLVILDNIVSETIDEKV